MGTDKEGRTSSASRNGHSKIRVGVIGVGNCASALVQGIEFYKNARQDEFVPGLMHVNLGGYHVRDIEFTAAFDIDDRKVGKDLSEAILQKPNNTYKFADVPQKGVTVSRGMTHDGLGKYLSQVITKASGPTDDIVGILKSTRTEVVVSYLPVGSEMATKWYVEQVLDAGCAFINCIPVFIASQPYWQKRFEERGLPIIGDDIKSQVGATITHRVLTNLFKDRGVRLDRTYQLNFGGNTDFMNMLERERLESKKISKTQAVTSQLDYPLNDEQAHVGPSDYVPWLADRKWCYIRMEGTTFGNVPLNCEVKLEVWDSPNSAGVVIDAIRCAKLALDRGMAGALIGPSSYFMKSPPQQFTDDEARARVAKFISNEEPRIDHDRSNQDLERTQQPVPLGFRDGPRLAGVRADGEAGSHSNEATVAEVASGAGRDISD
jgi:myo-inositol-1-phosphate synthase